MAHRPFAPLLAAVLAGGAFPPLPAAILKGPYLLEMTGTSARVRLEADDLSDTEVRFWPDGDASAVRTFIAVPEPLKVQLRKVSAQSAKKMLDIDEEHWLYDARLLGLAPATAYVYRVVHGGADGGGGRFRTFGTGGAAARFVVVGDTRTGTIAHRQLVRQFAAHRPDFVTILGDLALDGKVYAEWAPFFEIESAVFNDIPIYPVWGNHDARASYFERFFPFPRKAYSRSFDCGTVHVVVIDSGAGEDPEELKWLDADLAAARDRPWKVALYHHPSFNEGGQASAFGVAKLVPILRARGVDLTLAGHSHLYERTFPLKSVLKDERPIVHIVTGGGGAPLYADADAFYIAAHSKQNHFVLIQADDRRLEGSAIGLDGRPFDRFVLTKEGPGGPTAAPITAPEGAGGTGAAGTDDAGRGPVVAEEAVALWRALRTAFDSRARFRLPDPKDAAPALPAPVPWAVKVPASPIPRAVPVEIRLDPRDASGWTLVPSVDRFEWGGSPQTRYLAIGPRTAASLARKELPRLVVRVDNRLVGFSQKVAVKMTFAGDGRSTRRERL